MLVHSELRSIQFYRIFKPPEETLHPLSIASQSPVTVIKQGGRQTVALTPGSHRSQPTPKPGHCTRIWEDET